MTSGEDGELHKIWAKALHHAPGGRQSDGGWTETLPSESGLRFLAVEVKAVEEFVQSKGSMRQEKRESYVSD